MYTSFFNLDKKPFEINPDPSFLWLGKKHKAAFATLRYGILESKGFLLLTGEAGSGKTILMKALTQSLDKSVSWAVIVDPRLERIDFYNAIAKGFGIEKEFTSKVQFLIQFSHFLHMADDKNIKVLLLIDDCHRLSQEMLEELRLLSNIEKADAKLINIFFVGRPEFNEILVQPRNRAVRQRLTLSVDLPSLDVNETDDYIRYRLKVAGTEEKLFTAKAVQVVQRYSQGVPRRINTLCDLALVNGSIQTKQLIDNKMIESCIQKGDCQRNWLKYGFGLFVVLIAGGYFLHPAPHFLEKVKVAPVEIVKEPVMQNFLQVSSSPAVTMLEKSKSGISEKKATDLKIAILDKVYSNNEIEEETLAGVSSPASEIHKPLETPRDAKKDSFLGQTVSGQATASPPVVLKKQVVAPLAPMVPRKIRLGAQPNSQKLTRAAEEEFDSFVKKLKKYPRATILIKGFVSAKTNSPENIKLSRDRALVVQKLMLSKGIDAEQIEVVGMGDQKPIASNNTSSGRKKNRRVEIIIINDGIKEVGGN